MIQFTKPASLNGAQLINELKAAGIAITDWPTVDGEGNLLLDIASKDKVKAETIISAHVGVDIDNAAILEAKKQEVLAKLGLTAEEVTALLA